MSREALHALLRDLPPELQRAVQDAVARCRPEYRPRLYTNDWREELYHEAACAACEAWQRYDSSKGSLYHWGLRVISQRLQRFCDAVWAVCRCECEYPCADDEEGEFEIEDGNACEAVLEYVLCRAVRDAMTHLTEQERMVIELYYGDERLSERAIASRLGKSKTWVRKRLENAMTKLRRCLQGCP
jgi:RNA polymerase sigma factor (sigma-70 family)